jgi:hypothetical protein
MIPPAPSSSPHSSSGIASPPHAPASHVFSVRSPLTPAQDAAALLRRIGFAILVLAVPIAAMVSRRATVVLAPVGVTLMLLATWIDDAGFGLIASFKRILSRPEAVAGALLLGWVALSMLWTPFPTQGGEKALNLLGTCFMLLLGIAALPEKMRASNLYLMAIGTAGATVFAVVMALLGLFSGAVENASELEMDGRSLQRGLMILAIFIWPSVGWLASRGRRFEAMLLAAVAFIGTLPSTSSALTIALLAGGLTFGAVLFHPQKSTRIIAYGTGLLLALAPLIPFILNLMLWLVKTPNTLAALALRLWAEIISGDPLRLITGHGVEAAFRSRVTGLLPAQSPNSFLFEIWYDLGIVGAFSCAAVCVFLLKRMSCSSSPLLPAKFACFVTAATLGILGMGGAGMGGLGVGGTQIWWVTSLGLAALAFVASERGQFRHRLPKANKSLPL